MTVELSEEELARLRVVQRERSKAEGRPVSQGEALRMSFLENFLDTRPPGGVAFGAPGAGGTHADLRESSS